jgi:hypothetical protein
VLQVETEDHVPVLAVVLGGRPGAYEDHRRPAPGHQSLRDGADEEPVDTAQPPGPEDQQFGVLGCGQQDGDRLFGDERS